MKSKIPLCLVLLSILGCHHNPPNPNPTPTPTPNPPALDNNRTLRTNGTHLTLLDETPFNLDLAIQCCDAVPEVENSRWPLASKTLIDYYKGYSFNAIAFRLGPFYGDPNNESEWSDTGGPYTGGYSEVTGIYNDKFTNEVLSIADYAYSQKFWILVNIIDTWYCKHSSTKQGFKDQKMPWPQSDIDACGITMTPVQEDYIRHWVKLLGKYPNIIWHADIEGSLLKGYSCDWWNAQYNIIRDELKKNHYPDTLIGTNNEACASGPFEFVTTHSNVDLLAPIAGKFTINDERNPATDPAREISRFKKARDLGLSYAYWRDGSTLDQNNQALIGFKGVITGNDTITGCFAPDSEDPLWDTDTKSPTGPKPRGNGWTPDGNLKAAVNACKSELGPMTGKGHDLMLSSLAQCLRNKGFCASKASDAVMSKRTDNPHYYEEYHAVSYADDTWSNNDAVNPKMLWYYKGNTSDNNTCTGPVNTTDRVDCTMQQAYGLIDCTPKSHSQPIRPEGDPERSACEAKSVEPLGGFPQYSLLSDSLVLKTTGNPWQVIADKKGTGTLTCTFPNGGGNYCNPGSNGLVINKP